MQLQRSPNHLALNHQLSKAGANSRSPVPRISGMDRSPFQPTPKANSSFVDESLFGSARRSPFRPNDQQSAQRTRQIRLATEKGEQKDAAVISIDEIQRIKKAMVIKDHETIVAEKKQAQQETMMAQAAARIKKEKMKTLDMKRSIAVSKQEPTLTLEQKQRANGLLSNAMQLIDEQQDDVKDMNTKLLFSKVVTIRDKQLQENKLLEQDYLEEQKKLDLMMEIQRLKQAQEEELRDQKKFEARQKAGQVIVDQINEKFLQRQKDSELRNRELMLMKKAQEQQIRDEEDKIKEKQAKAKIMLMEVEKANQQSMLFKKKKMMEDIEDTERIEKYNKEKAHEDYERQAQAVRLKQDRERHLTMLREAQEKVTNQMGDIQGERAKRAFEQSERNARMREQLEIDKKQRLLEDLDQARKMQFKIKETNLAQQAKQERDEFLQIIDAQKEMDITERQIEDQKKQQFKHHSQLLQMQIDENQEVKRQKKLDYHEEGRKVRQKLADEHLKLETIKTNKINQMHSLGIDDKYKTDLIKTKIHVQI